MKPFWAKEYDLLQEKERIRHTAEQAMTLGELIATGVNAVRVYVDNTLLRYGYLEREWRSLYREGATGRDCVE